MNHPDYKSLRLGNDHPYFGPKVLYKQCSEKKNRDIANRTSYSSLMT